MAFQEMQEACLAPRLLPMPLLLSKVITQESGKQSSSFEI
jgi:hypothetical protein